MSAFFVLGEVSELMKMNQMTISVLDMDASRGFYQKLGCEMVVEGAEYSRMLAPDGVNTFSFVKVEAIADTSVCHLYFEFDSAAELDAKVMAFQAQGFAEFTDPVDQRWLWRESHVKDPSGFMVILYYAGENRLFPPWGVLSA